MSTSIVSSITPTTNVVAVARNCRNGGARVGITSASRTRSRGSVVVLAAAAVAGKTNGEDGDVNNNNDTALLSSDVGASGGVGVGVVTTGRRRAGLAAVTAAAGLAAIVSPTAVPPAFAGAAAKLDAVVELTPENFAREVEGANAGMGGSTSITALFGFIQSLTFAIKAFRPLYIQYNTRCSG